MPNGSKVRHTNTSARLRNEYHEYFWAEERLVPRGTNLTTLISRYTWNFWEPEQPQGPVYFSNGVDLLIVWLFYLVTPRNTAKSLSQCSQILDRDSKYSKTCLKRNAIVPLFFFRFHSFPFYKGLCFNKTKYKKYDRLGLQ